MVVFYLLALVIGFAFGLILSFWHKRLMLRLHGVKPDVWTELGRRTLNSDLWALSLRYPLWSWASLFFFLARQYKAVPDLTFRRQAARFRFGLLVWLAYCLLCSISVVMSGLLK